MPFSACGKRPSHQLFIVGGSEASAHSYPWIAAVYQKGSSGTRFICGASIINELWVLCAAHCVVRSEGVLKPSNFQLRFGAHDLTKPNEGYFRDVDDIVAHESYRNDKHQADIAMFKLSEPLKWTKDVAPICLPTPAMDHNEYVGELSTLIGWGTTKFGNQRASDILQEVEVPIVSTAECNANYSNGGGMFPFGGNDQIGKAHLCAGYPEGGKDTCQV